MLFFPFKTELMLAGFSEWMVMTVCCFFVQFLKYFSIICFLDIMICYFIRYCCYLLTGCDVIITKDKGVSRVHAEIIVNTMIHSVQIRDCSKYGTFVSKNVGPKKKVHELPNKETALQDGDLVSFGTGSATYKYVNYVVLFLLLWLCHSPLIFRKCCCSAFLV